MLKCGFSYDAILPNQESSEMNKVVLILTSTFLTDLALDV